MSNQQSVVDLFRQIASNEFGFFSRLQSVMDLLDTNVPTVSCDTNFGQFVGRKSVRSIGAFGVVDPDDKQLIGVIGRSTVQRCYPRFLNTLAEKEEDSKILGTSILSIVTRTIPHVSPSATPLEVVEILLNGDCDCVFVCEDKKKILGIVRPSDFLKTMMAYYQIYNKPKPLQRLRLIDLDVLGIDEVFFRGAQTARDIAQPIVCIDEKESVIEAIKLMHEHQIDVIGLQDKEERVTKVLTVEDIFIAQAIPDGLRSLAQFAGGREKSSSQPPSKLDLLPLDVLCATKDPAMSEAASSLAGTQTTAIEPTTRIPEVLTALIEAEEGHVLLVKDGSATVGTITVQDILRIHKTLFRIQEWGDASVSSQ